MAGYGKRSEDHTRAQAEALRQEVLVSGSFDGDANVLIAPVNEALSENEAAIPNVATHRPHSDESRGAENDAAGPQRAFARRSKEARPLSDASAAIVDTVSRRVTSILSLALLKAVAHRARPKDYPLDSGAGGAEQRFLRWFDRLPRARQEAATERALRALDAHGGTAGAFPSFEELVRIDLRSPVSVREQADRLALFRERDPAVHRFLSHFGTFAVGAEALQLRIHKIRCHDETGVSIKLPNPFGNDIEVGGEGGEDEIYLGGIAIDPTLFAPTPQGSLNLRAVEIPPYHVGDFDDGEEVNYYPPRVFFQFDLSRGLTLPHMPFHVLLILAEHDNGDVYGIVKEAADVARHGLEEGAKDGLKPILEEALKPKPRSATGGAQTPGTGPHGPGGPHEKKDDGKGGGVIAIVAAAVAAVIATIVVKIFDALVNWIREWWGDDLFPPQRADLVFPGPELGGDQLVTPLRSVVFEAHKGKYELWYDWLLVKAPRRPVIGCSGPICYYPINHQLEFCRIRPDGRVWLHWKANNAPWQAPVPLTPAAFAPSNGGIALVYYPLNDQLETLTVGNDGRVHILWKANNGAWQGSVAISPPGFTPGAAITAAFYPPNNQLEALTVGNDGRIGLLWKANNGPWQGPVGISPPAFVPGGGIACTYYPLNEQLEALTVGTDGRVGLVWKANNGPWQGPVGISPPDFAPGGGIACAYYPLNEQLEALTVDKNGRVALLWKANNDPWQGPVGISPAAFAPPGAGISLSFYPPNNQLEALVIGSDGRAHILWKANNGPWQGPVAISPPIFAPGTRIASAYYPLNEQLEALAVSAAGQLHVMWKASNGPWQGPAMIDA